MNPEKTSKKNKKRKEDEWIKKIKKGDQKAFEELYRYYYPRLGQFVFRYVHSKYLAEDLVHNVFYNVWENRSKLEARGTLKSYLFTAARNQALNYLEKREVRKFEEPEAVVQLESLESGPSQEMSAKELEQAVIKAVKEIPDKRRNIFLMHREDELTYREIAEMLDISVKTVETQMSRSLKFLRYKLSEFLPVVVLLLLALFFM